ncbi:MAG: hypothetical protein ACLGHY_02755 [Gammaproteobacteria bacterium]
MDTGVVVRFPEDEYELHPATVAKPEEARRWLDEQFAALGARAPEDSGETGIAGKALAVATAAGPGMFLNDDVWTERYGSSVLGALERSQVCVDVVAKTTS